MDNLEELYESDEEAKSLVVKTENEFYKMLSEFEFLPNSPTLMNAGNNLQQLSGCYVIPIEDSIEGWATALTNAIKIHKSGGGTGMSFGRVRPQGDNVSSTKGIASGPISPLRMIDVATGEIRQGGTRRGANMGILPITHPNIKDFIEAKDPDNKTTKQFPLENFNLSVGVTEDWMKAVLANKNYDLINHHSGKKVGELNAADIFKQIIKMAHKTGDPGMIFLDRINSPFTNPTPQLGTVESTNPCGEQPLLPNESCNLGSINLSTSTKYEKDKYVVDKDDLEKRVYKAVRFLDNVIEMNNYPLDQIEKMTKRNRKIGLGVMGFAEMLVKLNIPYDSEEAISLAEDVMSFINKKAMEASEELAKTRGAFPNYKFSIFNPENKEYIGYPYYPRNAGRTTIAPTGTIAQAAGVQGYGIEPFFGIAYIKKNANAIDAENRGEKPEDKDVFYEFIPQFLEAARKNNFFGIAGNNNEEKEKTLGKLISKNHGSIQSLDFIPQEVKKVFVIAHDVSYKWHIRMQAEFQKYTDHAVSKTVNLPASAPEEDVEEIYNLANELGCKGVTIYRDTSKPIQVVDFGKDNLLDRMVPDKVFPREKYVYNPSNEIEFDVFSPSGEKLPSIFITPAYQRVPEEKISQLIEEEYQKIMRNQTTKEELIKKVLDYQKGRLNQIFIDQGKSGADEKAHAESLGKLISLGLQMGIAPQVYYNTLVGIESNTRPRTIKDKKIIQFNSIEDAIAEIIKEYIVSIDEPINKKEIGSYYEKQNLSSPYREQMFKIAESSPAIRKKIQFSNPNGPSKVYLQMVENTDGLLGEVFIDRGKSGANENAHAESLGKLISTCLKYGMHPYIVVQALTGIKSSQTSFSKNGIYQSLEDGVAREIERWYSQRGIDLKEHYNSFFNGEGLIMGLGESKIESTIQKLREPCLGCGSREYETRWESRGCGFNTCCDYKIGSCD